MLIDTHCHIHDVEYDFDTEAVIAKANQNGVKQLICIGTRVDDSVRALDFAESHDNIFAAVGVHPHYAEAGCAELVAAIDWTRRSLVAVGEIGLDYHYNNSSKQSQIEMLEAQIDLALRHSLPIVFHVREAFDDFWPVFDNFHNIRGVIHCFTDNQTNIDKALARNLMIGVGGFCTFVKGEEARNMFANIPIDSVLLETDAPYLTPSPFRGTINEPANVLAIANYFAKIRRISIDEVADSTTKNARGLFGLEK